MVTRPRSDRGAIEGYFILAMFGLVLVSVMVAVIAAAFVRHEQARTAADFAALAAAQRQDCQPAAAAAERNGAVLRGCSLREGVATVSVASPTGFGHWLILAGAPTHYLASARALR